MFPYSRRFADTPDLALPALSELDSFLNADYLSGVRYDDSKCTLFSTEPRGAIIKDWKTAASYNLSTSARHFRLIIKIRLMLFFWK
jgi:hypothetical protein